jgi:hypothetical protein
MAEGVSIFSPPPAPPTNTSPAEVRHVPGSLPPGVLARSDPPESQPQQRWREMQEEITRSRPWADPSLLLTKNERGEITARPRNHQPQPGTQPQQQSPGQQTQPQPTPVASVEGDRLKIGDYSLSPGDIAGLMERKGLEDSRRAQMPERPGDYSLDLPSDFQLPEGVAEWQWKMDDPVLTPLLGQAKEWAHSNGLSQVEFSKVMSLFAQHQLSEQRMFADAKRSELEKLGSAAPTRVDAVRTWVHAMVGDAAPHLLRVLEQAPMASTIVAFEKLMSRWSSQGIGGSPGAHRDGTDGRGPQRISDEAYSKLSYTEKQQYAAQFPQNR